MTSITASLFRRTSSIRRKTVSGVKDSIRSAHLTRDNGSTYDSNEHIHHSFYELDGYLVIIKCLNDGHKIGTNIIEYMQGHCDITRDYAKALSAHSNKWTSKVNGQSVLSSYFTTKRAHLQTVKALDDQAQLLNARCDEMQEVIDHYKQLVDRMYPAENFGRPRKHYRAERLRKAFKSAQATLLKLAESLEKLRDEQHEAANALRDANILCENVRFDSPDNKKKMSKAADAQKEREYELQSVEDKLAQKEKDYANEEEAYRERALKIYEECRDYEKERLDQIRQVLIDFFEVAHTNEFSAKQDTLFAELIKQVKREQNSIDDLDFWGRTYKAIDLEKSSSSETLASTTVPATTQPTRSESASAAQPASDDHEQVPSVKSKKKNSNSSTSAEPTTPAKTKST